MVPVGQVGEIFPEPQKTSASECKGKHSNYIL